jgi:carboxyl-terminal processing protease
VSAVRQRSARVPRSITRSRLPEEETGYAQISVFARAVQMIRQDYVDSKKTSYHDLIYAAMKGMLASLDPHSQFMDPDDFKDMQDDTRAVSTGSASRSR